MQHLLINVGCGNYVSAARIMSIADPDSAPAKREMSILRSADKLRDYTKGRKTRALIHMDDGGAIQSILLPETLAGRCAGKKDA